MAHINPARAASGSRYAIPPASPCSGRGARFGTDGPEAAHVSNGHASPILHHARCLIDSNMHAEAGNEQPSAHVSRLQHSHRFVSPAIFPPTECRSILHRVFSVRLCDGGRRASLASVNCGGRGQLSVGRRSLVESARTYRAIYCSWTRGFGIVGRRAQWPSGMRGPILLRSSTNQAVRSSIPGSPPQGTSAPLRSVWSILAARYRSMRPCSAIRRSVLAGTSPSNPASVVDTTLSGTAAACRGKRVRRRRRRTRRHAHHLHIGDAARGNTSVTAMRSQRRSRHDGAAPEADRER
jgi:hypothetical protein